MQLDFDAGILDFTCDVERLDNGNTLIADAGNEVGTGSEVFEVDPEGNIVWQCTCDLKFAHSCKRLPDGTTLIADTLNDRVIMVDQDSNIVFTTDDWRNKAGVLSDGSKLHYPNDAHMVQENHLLITDRNNNRCVITDLQGTVLWEFSENIKHPHNADLLENGNILLANSDANCIWEISPEKEIVWCYGEKEGEEISFPRDADRLANDNTLITDSRNHRVIEVTPQGEIVWQYQVDYYASFYEADRLANGNTLIADQHHHQVLEVAPNGDVVWKFRNRTRRLVVHDKLTNGFFKKKDKDGFPEEWFLYTRFAEGGGKYISEDGAPGLEFDRGGALCLSQYIAVAEGGRYKFCGQIKTQDIKENHFACFQAFFVDELGGPIYNTMSAPKTEMLEGSNDWREEVLEFDVPARAAAVELRLMVNGPGKVWARKLMMHPL